MDNKGFAEKEHLPPAVGDGHVHMDNHFPHLYDGLPLQITKHSKLELYLASSKGNGVARGVTSIYALFMWTVAIALILSEALSASNIVVESEPYFIYMYILSSVMMVVILVLAGLDQLTNDHHYKEHTSELFLRAGATVLGMGGLIYEAVVITTYFTSDEECQVTQHLVNSIFATIFILLEIIIVLNYTKMHINKSVWVSVMARIFTMQIIATNVCVWVQTIVIETVEEIERDEGHHAAFAADSHDNDTCHVGEDIVHTVAPYVLPLRIEYSVVAATMVLAMWEKCGLGLQVPYIDLHHDNHSNSHHDNHSHSSGHKDSKYYNNHVGFIIGYLAICLSIAVIILYLIFLNTENGYTEKLENAIFSFDLAVKACILIAVPVTIYAMSRLTTKDLEIKNLRAHHNHAKEGQSIHRSLDMNLLTITFFAGLLFQMFTIVAAIENNSPFILANAIVSIIMGISQTLFINWYGITKRATKEKHVREKPGRQGLEIMRCCNLALWGIHTFIVANIESKRIHVNTFGFEAWVILSNITQPLNILYHFHAAACLAEIISHAYTSKYLGIERRKSVFSIGSKHSNMYTENNDSGTGSISYPLQVGVETESENGSEHGSNENSTDSTDTIM